ncbi:MAG: DsbA family protein [Pseudonocardiaceae bacterium]
MSTPQGLQIAVPASATEAGDGVVVGSGPVPVDTYIDFQCPFCRQFELASGATLTNLVRDGLISLIYHPMNFLDPASTNRYSTRAAASSGCAADGSRFAEYAHVLFVNQPPEGGPGLTDDELITLGATAGLDEAQFGACVRNGTYLSWPSYVTERAVARGVNGTPTVFVAGLPVPANARMIAAAVASVVS